MIEELSRKEFNALNEAQKDKYTRAIGYSKSEHAGGGYGWAVGYKLLKEMGWKEVKRTQGHRSFVSLEKPFIVGGQD